MNKGGYKVIEVYDDSCGGEEKRVIYTVALEERPDYTICVDIMVSEESQVIYAMEQGMQGGTVYELGPWGARPAQYDYPYDEAKALSLAIDRHEQVYGKITWTDTRKLIADISRVKEPDRLEDVLTEEEAEEYLEYISEYRPMIKPAGILPDSWNWVMYSDGSGSLKSPDGKSYFSYDKAPYANAGWIEYQTEKSSGWSIFEDSFSEFQKFAEEYIAKNVLKTAENDKEDTVER